MGWMVLAMIGTAACGGPGASVGDQRIAPAPNRLEIRGVNTRGVAGPPAVVTLTFRAG
jgi:hypothetical protein